MAASGVVEIGLAVALGTLARWRVAVGWMVATFQSAVGMKPGRHGRWPGWAPRSCATNA